MEDLKNINKNCIEIYFDENTSKETAYDNNIALLCPKYISFNNNLMSKFIYPHIWKKNNYITIRCYIEPFTYKKHVNLLIGYTTEVYKIIKYINEMPPTCKSLNLNFSNNTVINYCNITGKKLNVPESVNALNIFIKIVTSETITNVKNIINSFCDVKIYNFNNDLIDHHEIIKNECNICYENKHTIKIHNHNFNLCNDCIKKITTCPICRLNI